MSTFTPDPKNYNSMEMWVICAAIGSNRDLIDKMKKNKDGSYPVVFSVGGVELDFNMVTKRIKEQLDEFVAEKAMTLLIKRYDGLLDDISDIQERLSNHKEMFKYVWEEENND